MHTPEEQPRDGGDLQQEIEVENVADIRQAGPQRPFTRSSCHLDLPTFVSDGQLYVAIPLSGLLEAITAGLSARIGGLEIGVPEAWRSTLSPDDLWTTFSGEGVA